MDITRDEIARRLTNRPPETVLAGHRLDRLTDEAVRFGCVLVELVPQGRELAQAVAKLEEALAWAKKGVALGQDDQVDPLAEVERAGREGVAPSRPDTPN